jgi:hypothetical protein
MKTPLFLPVDSLTSTHRVLQHRQVVVNHSLDMRIDFAFIVTLAQEIVNNVQAETRHVVDLMDIAKILCRKDALELLQSLFVAQVPLLCHCKCHNKGENAPDLRWVCVFDIKYYLPCQVTCVVDSSTQLFVVIPKSIITATDAVGYQEKKRHACVGVCFGIWYNP